MRGGNATVRKIFISFTERLCYLLHFRFRKRTREHLADAALDMEPVFNRHLFDLVKNLARAHFVIMTPASSLFNSFNVPRAGRTPISLGPDLKINQ